MFYLICRIFFVVDLFFLGFFEFFVFYLID